MCAFCHHKRLTFELSWPGGLPLALRLSEGLGAACRALMCVSSWWKAPPGYGDKKTEHCVCRGEHPERCLIEQYLLSPVFNEALAVGHLSSLRSKPRLQYRQWTQPAEPGLNNDYANGYKVRDAKLQVVCPAPTLEIPCYDGKKPADHEHYDGEVQEKYCICN